MAHKGDRDASRVNRRDAKPGSSRRASRASRAGAEEPPPKLKGRKYAKELRRLQTRLCHLQVWVRHKGLRVIVVFEGRDGAGKGGTIRAINERVSPRVFRVVALPRALGPREEPDVHPALHASLPGRGRDRDHPPQLVQPRRGRVGDGVLHA